MLLSFLEKLVCELPSVRYNLSKTLASKKKKTQSESVIIITITSLLVSSTYIRKEAYIGVELPDETREVVVLEVIRKEIAGELRRAPDDEGGVVFAPGDDVIGGGVVHQLIGFGEEGGWH